MSSAPAITNLEPDCDDEEETAAQYNEAFLASLVFEDRTGTNDGGYTSSGEGPVQITANMMSNDELWLLHSDTTVPSTRSDDPTPSVLITPAVPTELQPTVRSLAPPSQASQ
jgi:hypothetical protein